MEDSSSVDELIQRHASRVELVDDLEPVTDSRSSEGSRALPSI
jgi:hypothetical protein